MLKDITVVISCAGMGTRLGIDTTKSLLDICGKPLIIRQLKLLDNVQDVRIVVGYQAEKVIETVKEYRRDVMFAFNYEYQSTGAGASLSKGIVGSNKYIVSIDGDLVVHPEDMEKVLSYQGNVVCGSALVSDTPVLINIEGDQVVGFSNENSQSEWIGITKIENNVLVSETGHVYQMLLPLLPIDYLQIRAIDIDTTNDYEKAVSWVSQNYLNL